MIFDNVEQFAGKMQDDWVGRNIVITKMPGQKGAPGGEQSGSPQSASGCRCSGQIVRADSAPAIGIKLDEVKVIPWEEVDRRIQGKYHRDSKFLVVSGKDTAQAGTANGASLRNIIIHVDGGTVFDVRENRLVLLSEQEVIQFKDEH